MKRKNKCEKNVEKVEPFPSNILYSKSKIYLSAPFYFKLMKSNHKPNTAKSTTKPCPCAPHPYVFEIAPEMVEIAPPSLVYSSSLEQVSPGTSSHWSHCLLVFYFYQLLFRHLCKFWAFLVSNRSKHTNRGKKSSQNKVLKKLLEDYKINVRNYVKLNSWLILISFISKLWNFKWK